MKKIPKSHELIINGTVISLVLVTVIPYNMRKLLIIVLLFLFFPAFSQTSENSYFAKEQKTEAYLSALNLDSFLSNNTSVVFML